MLFVLLNNKARQFCHTKGSRVCCSFEYTSALISASKALVCAIFIAVCLFVYLYSEEALGAYYRALEGKPTYVRARANLGISFLALNEYPDAAGSFLAALRLHPNAAHLWDNLKMVFRLMGRDDLEERATNHNIDDFSTEFTDMALKM